MPILKDNTVVSDPDTGQATPLYAGDEVPAWAIDQVGDHLVEVDEDGTPDYSAGTKAELQKAVDTRNADRAPEAQIVVEGTGKDGAVVKDDLVKALEKDDAAQAAAADSSNE